MRQLAGHRRNQCRPGIKDPGPLVLNLPDVAAFARSNRAALSAGAGFHFTAAVNWRACRRSTVVTDARGSLPDVCSCQGANGPIENAHGLAGRERRGDPFVPELGVAQIREQDGAGVNRVDGGRLAYDPESGGRLAIKQARAILIEAVS